MAPLIPLSSKKVLHNLDLICFGWLAMYNYLQLPNQGLTYPRQKVILDSLAVFWKSKHNISQQPNEEWKGLVEMIGILLTLPKG